MTNVILLTIDACRKDAIGCHKEPVITPFIDSIQDHCIRFTKAHSPGPYTQAAFPGILTSSYYLEYGRQKMLSEKRILISEVLQRAGIVTAAFHSNPYLSEYFGWNRGWGVFYDSMDDEVDDKVPYIKAGGINSKVSSWLSSHTRGGFEYTPFFLWLHYMDVHEPYVPERKYLDLVDPSIKLNDQEMFDLFQNVLLKRDVSDREVVETLRKLYCAHVLEIDEGVREFFGILEKYNVLKQSVIIITSDHGDEFGEHGGLSHDGKMYEELVNVPLLIYGPERKDSEVSDLLVSTLDIPPTITYLFGLNPVDVFEGHSLLPLEDYAIKGVFGEAVDKRGSKEKGQEKEVHYYLEDDLKIIYCETDDFWELYDLKSDPGERTNIIKTVSVAKDLKQKVIPRLRRYQR